MVQYFLEFVGPRTILFARARTPKLLRNRGVEWGWTCVKHPQNWTSAEMYQLLAWIRVDSSVTAHPFRLHPGKIGARQKPRILAVICVCVRACRGVQLRYKFQALEPHRPLHARPAACVIAQQYFSEVLVSLCLHYCKEEFGARLCYLIFRRVRKIAQSDY